MPKPNPEALSAHAHLQDIPRRSYTIKVKYPPRQPSPEKK